MRKSITAIIGIGILMFMVCAVLIIIDIGDKKSIIGKKKREVFFIENKDIIVGAKIKSAYQAYQSRIWLSIGELSMNGINIKENDLQYNSVYDSLKMLLFPYCGEVYYYPFYHDITTPKETLLVDSLEFNIKDRLVFYYKEKEILFSKPIELMGGFDYIINNYIAPKCE